MILPRRSLVTIYKSFVRPHLDYGDIIFNQVFNKSFHDNLESIQYNASFTITGTIGGSSREKLYLSNKGIGFANCAPSTRYIKMNLRVISTTYYSCKPARASSDHSRIYPVFILNIAFSKILFSLLQLLNGTI